MTTLAVFDEAGAASPELLSEPGAIAARLGSVGVTFERWQADRPLTPAAEQDEVLAAYDEDIARLNAAFGFQSIDVVSLRPDHPDKEALRAKFLDEHTHADFEVRFFVGGRGLFYIHTHGKVYCLLCEAGDLISVPANTTHWFDMGERPDFKCIRFFTQSDGWVGEFTGSDIARRFPDFDQFVARYV